MSVDYYIGCAHCKKALHVAQDGMSGFTFYRGQEDTMKLLGALLSDHTGCGMVMLLSESDIDEDDDPWEVRDSHGNVIPDPDRDESSQGGNEEKT